MFMYYDYRFKNGQPITFNDKFSAEQKEGKFTLILKDATQDDAGCYSCSVTNKAGTLSSEAQLVIESKNIFMNSADKLMVF